jgi:hypothetical protein
MKTWFAATFIMIGPIGLTAISVLVGCNGASSASAARAPVIVELFTSEGCSSCPPADDVLARLARTQPVRNAEIIALSEHVDYWNQLGWTDPFSSPQFSARQNEYAQVFRGDGIYTPQVVVDGRVQFVGGDMNEAIDAIGKAAKAPKATVQITRLEAAGDHSVRFHVEVDTLPRLTDGDSADVLLAISENDLRSNVARGENAGRKLTHTSVVRRLSPLGAIDSNLGRFAAEPSVSLDEGWRADQLRAVAFVQERTSRHILGAAVIGLSVPK